MGDYEKILKILEVQNKKIDELKKLLTQNATEIISSKKSKSKSPQSITGFITLMSKEGFFDTPKTLKEISEELARRGYHYRTTSLSQPIQTLLRKRSLGRIVVNGKWAYVKR